MSKGVLTFNGRQQTRGGVVKRVTASDKYIYCGDKEGYLYIIDEAGNLVAESNESNRINSIAVNEAGEIYAAMSNSIVRKYTLENGAITRQALYDDSTSRNTRGCTFNRFGRVAITYGNNSGELLVLDSDLNFEWQYNTTGTSRVRQCAWSPSGEYIAVGNEGGYLAILMDLGEGGEVIVNSDSFFGSVSNIEWLSETELIVQSDQHGTAAIKKLVIDYDLETLTEIWSVTQDETETNFDWLIGLTVSRNRTIYSGDFARNKIYALRDLGSSAEYLWTYTVAASGGFGAGIHCLSVRPDNSELFFTTYAENLNSLKELSGTPTLNWTNTNMRDETTECAILYNKVGEKPNAFVI